MMKDCDIFLNYGPNIDFWISLEPPYKGDSNELHNICLSHKREKFNVYSCKPHFLLYKVVFTGCTLYVNSMRKMILLHGKSKLWMPG